MKLIALFLVLLASPVFAQETSALNNPLWACGPDAAKFEVTTTPAADVVPVQLPEQGQALVYVIQDLGETNCLGECSVTTRVGLDGSWIGANKGRSYFSFSVSPGEHHLCTNVQSRFAYLSVFHSLANFTADAGKTYFFRLRFLSSSQVPQPDLEPTNSDQARYLVSFSNLATPHPKK